MSEIVIMLKNLKSAVTSSTVPNLTGRVKFPERLKGTFLEKWADYWKNMFIDYKQMLADLRTDIQDEPKKAMFYTTGLATLYALAKNNPDELEFQNTLKRIENDMTMVSDEIRNEKATEHVNFLTSSYNQRVLHYRSLGIASIMYTSDITDGCDLYKAHCDYLKPTYFNLLSRIVDFGFMGRWWNLYIKTVNYDVKD